MPKLVVLEQSLPAVAGGSTTSWTSPGRCTSRQALGRWGDRLPQRDGRGPRVSPVKAPALIAVDEDADRRARRPSESSKIRYMRHYRVVCLRSSEEARPARGAGRRRRGRRAGPCRPDAIRPQRQRAPGGGAPTPPARQARAPDPVGRLGRAGDRRRDLRLDRPRPDRPLRPAAAGIPDELFHQAVSSMLLEWTGAARRPLRSTWWARPWSGRATSRDASSAARFRTPSAWRTRATGAPPGRGRHRREAPGHPLARRHRADGPEQRRAR